MGYVLVVALWFNQNALTIDMQPFQDEDACEAASAILKQDSQKYIIDKNAWVPAARIYTRCIPAGSN